MHEYNPRNRASLNPFHRQKQNMPCEAGEELVLKLDKRELFDTHVLLPHAELNEIVFNAVNQFVAKYRGERLKIVVYCGVVNQATQDTFREVYRVHYEDEYQKISRFLARRYIRVAMLLVISALAYYGSRLLNAHMTNNSFLLDVVANIGVFCLWEIGYTHFARADASEERRRILRARDAEIEFMG